MEFNLQFNKLRNRMEAGNQLLSLQSPRLGHTLGSLKELQLGWLSSEAAVLRGSFGLCCRVELFCCSHMRKATWLFLHKVLLYIFVSVVVVVVGSSVGKCRALGGGTQL